MLKLSFTFYNPGGGGGIEKTTNVSNLYLAELIQFSIFCNCGQALAVCLTLTVKTLSEDIVVDSQMKSSCNFKQAYIHHGGFFFKVYRQGVCRYKKIPIHCRNRQK